MNERITELANRAIVERANGFREFDANVFAKSGQNQKMIPMNVT